MNAQTKEFQSFLDDQNIVHEFESEFEVVIYPKNVEDKHQVYLFLRRKLIGQVQLRVRYDYIALKTESYQLYCEALRRLRVLAVNNGCILFESSKTSFTIYYRTASAKQILQQGIKSYYDRKFMLDPQGERTGLLYLQLKPLYADGVALNQAELFEIRKRLFSVAEFCHCQLIQSSQFEFMCYAPNPTILQIVDHKLSCYRGLQIWDEHNDIRRLNVITELTNNIDEMRAIKR